MEQIQEHDAMPDRQARERTVELLDKVGIPRARDRLDSYPHEFSGGMRQRVMIALALSCDPSVLIADEPTTALDVTIQAQILERIRELRDETGAAVILVTHDLGVVADIADRIAVMYSGRIVEQGTLDEIFYDPQHPYTWGLLGSITRVDRPRPERLPAIAGLPPSLANRPEGCHFRPRCPHEFAKCAEVPPLEERVQAAARTPGPLLALACPEGGASRGAPGPDRARRQGRGALRVNEAVVPLVDVDHLKVFFSIKEGLLVDREVARVHAVNDVTLSVAEGETVGLVGESGCGKTTISRTIMRLIDSTEGSIHFRGKDITSAGRRELEPLRREMQMVFQDPFASLNPRKRVAQIIGQPLRLHGTSRSEVEDRVGDLLKLVGLQAEHLNRYPHEFSGGQRQRIGVARALALEPRLIVLDEPVSALDVSVQAQIINLLDDLQDEFKLTYLFVAHDLSVVRHVSDRIAVMYLGKLMELSPAEELYTKPIHPYTSALLSAIPIPDPRENRSRERVVVGGEPPNPINPPSGCVFHTRCPRATEVCREVEPPLARYANGHLAACHHPLNVSAEEVGAAVRDEASPHSAGEELPSASANGDSPAGSA